jgi:hypothetical protein
MGTDPTNVDDPGTVDPADQDPGLGVPAQVTQTPQVQTPGSDAGPVVEVENESVGGGGLPKNVNQ